MRGVFFRTGAALWGCQPEFVSTEIYARLFELLYIHHLSKTDYPFSHRLIGCSILTQALVAAVPVLFTLFSDHCPLCVSSGGKQREDIFRFLT